MSFDITTVATIVGGIAGSISGFIASYLVVKLKINQANRVWDREFSVQYAKLLFSDPGAARLLARQFSIGLIIVRTEDGQTESKYFIPYQCKISIGRSIGNDICLRPNTVSRDHGVLFYRGKKVIYHELSPLNKSTVNGVKVNKFSELKSGDILNIGGVNLEYEALT